MWMFYCIESNTQKFLNFEVTAYIMTLALQAICKTCSKMYNFTGNNWNLTFIDICCQFKVLCLRENRKTIK